MHINFVWYHINDNINMICTDEIKYYFIKKSNDFLKPTDDDKLN